jgi:two-component system chemotaxis response regulator CheB
MVGDAVDATTSRPFWVIVIAASAGGLPEIQKIVASLPATLPAAVVIVLHRTTSPPRLLDRVLTRISALPVVSPEYGEAVRPGCLYIARPDLHLTIEQHGQFAYVDGTRVRGVLSSANPLLESAAKVFANRTIAVVLSGSGLDATDGVQTVKALGGVVIVQDPATAAYSGMPSSALNTGAVDRVLPVEAIGPSLLEIISSTPIEGVHTG